MHQTDRWLTCNDGALKRLLDIWKRALRPAYSRNWETLGCVPKDGRSGSIVEVGRIQDTRIKFDVSGPAECYGMELSRMVVIHCLPSSGWGRELSIRLAPSPFRMVICPKHTVQSRVVRECYTVTSEQTRTTSLSWHSVKNAKRKNLKSTLFITWDHCFFFGLPRVDAPILFVVTTKSPPQ
jgi:hypothetical protein